MCVVWEKCDLINKIPRKQYERNPTDSHNPRINQTHLSDNSPEQETATIFTTCRLFSSQLRGCLALSCAVPDSWSNMKTWNDGEINLTVSIVDYEYHLKWKLSVVWVDDPESTNGTILSSDQWSHLDQTPVFSDTAFVVIIKENWDSCNITTWELEYHSILSRSTYNWKFIGMEFDGWSFLLIIPTVSPSPTNCAWITTLLKTLNIQVT